MMSQPDVNPISVIGSIAGAFMGVRFVWSVRCGSNGSRRRYPGKSQSCRGAVPIVLVVEDEVQVRMLAESVLEAAGYEVLSAGTLLEAQALIETDQRIDGLLLDI